MPTSPLAAALDSAALGRLRRTMGSEGEYRSMLGEFLTASQRVLGDLQASAREGRWSDAERAAHTLKSMARMVGANDLAEACAEAEASGPRMPAGSVAGVARRVALAQEAVRACLA